MPVVGEDVEEAPRAAVQIEGVLDKALGELKRGRDAGVGVNDHAAEAAAAPEAQERIEQAGQIGPKEFAGKEGVLGAESGVEVLSGRGQAAQESGG
jgi:hypothetical protein